MELRGLCISLPMKTPFFQYIIVIVTGSVIFASCQYDSISVLSFIRRVTKISIPADISTISEFDQGELEAGGKYQLKQKDLEEFLSTNYFHSIDQEYYHLSRFNFYSRAGLIPPSDSIPFLDKFHLKYFYGCRKGNFWLFTLNKKSGELWIEVQYPDFGGQGPSCNSN
jgi:hypothetical protein